MDTKKIIGVVAGFLLAALLGFAAKSGIEIPCPANPSAVISVPAK